MFLGPALATSDLVVVAPILLATVPSLLRCQAFCGAKGCQAWPTIERWSATACSDLGRPSRCSFSEVKRTSRPHTRDEARLIARRRNPSSAKTNPKLGTHLGSEFAGLQS